MKGFVIASLLIIGVSCSNDRNGPAAAPEGSGGVEQIYRWKMITTWPKKTSSADSLLRKSAFVSNV